MKKQSQTEKMPVGIEQLSGVEAVLKRIASCESLTSILGGRGVSRDVLSPYLEKGSPAAQRREACQKVRCRDAVWKRPWHSLAARRPPARVRRMAQRRSAKDSSTMHQVRDLE
jgi:hypothetical protein